MSNREPDRSIEKPKPLPIVFGCSGLELTSAERNFFGASNPFGIILFKRNCKDQDQVKWLIKAIRQSIGRMDVPIFIDQEGGRVSRLQPPHWPQYPPARLFGILYENDPEWGAEAMKLYARIVANELAHLGFTVNCAPILDLYVAGASSAIGDRALSRKPAVVAALARIWSEAFLANGILPVIKHFPGHGRIKSDPHDALPSIDASRAELDAEDFVPFELLKDLPIGMNSHAVFTNIDPHNAASLSAVMHQDIIRGVQGFDGLLLSDDITMKALQGEPGELAKRALAAGSDVVLHCNAKMNEMQAIADVIEPIANDSWLRWEHAKSMVYPVDTAYKSFDDSSRLDILLGGMAYEVETIV